MKVYLNKFMTYSEIHRLHKEGLSISKISKTLNLNWRTVSKYLSMDEKEYEAFVFKQANRPKLLLPYEGFVYERLDLFEDTTAAQMHDWLKEHHPDFPEVSQKTVFNFVSWVRKKYQLPTMPPQRQFGPVPESPYGKQIQVDFGQYNMRTTTDGRVKVYFCTFVLSRSRLKYVWFTNRPFTSEFAIVAHEKAFAFFEGVPDEIVYDQDRVFVVSENGGDIILTQAFREYTRNHSFELHFCRKSDPQSKGKVENVVKYVKQNFLYNRPYHNIEVLNEEALGWLERTANYIPHGTTKKRPCEEYVIEKPFLKPYKAHTLPKLPLATYTVRKDNMISYKGNYYSLPLGTYKGKGSVVAIRVEGSHLIIIEPTTEQEICRHKIPLDRGNKVINNNHKRDLSTAIGEMIEEAVTLFKDQSMAREWLHTIKADKPRYIRDQLAIVMQAAQQANTASLSAALELCYLHKISSATDFKSILTANKKDQKMEPKIIALNPLNGQAPKGAFTQPQKSSIADFEAILRKS